MTEELAGIYIDKHALDPAPGPMDIISNDPHVAADKQEPAPNPLPDIPSTDNALPAIFTTDEPLLAPQPSKFNPLALAVIPSLEELSTAIIRSPSSNTTEPGDVEQTSESQQALAEGLREANVIPHRGEFPLWDAFVKRATENGIRVRQPSALRDREVYKGGNEFLDDFEIPKEFRWLVENLGRPLIERRDTAVNVNFARNNGLAGGVVPASSGGVVVPGELMDAGNIVGLLGVAASPGNVMTTSVEPRVEAMPRSNAWAPRREELLANPVPLDGLCQHWPGHRHPAPGSWQEWDDRFLVPLEELAQHASRHPAPESWRGRGDTTLRHFETFQSRAGNRGREESGRQLLEGSTYAEIARKAANDANSPQTEPILRSRGRCQNYQAGGRQANPRNPNYGTIVASCTWDSPAPYAVNSLGEPSASNGSIRNKTSATNTSAWADIKASTSERKACRGHDQFEHHEPDARTRDAFNAWDSTQVIPTTESTWDDPPNTIAWDDPLTTADCGYPAPVLEPTQTYAPWTDVQECRGGPENRRDRRGEDVGVGYRGAREGGEGRGHSRDSNIVRTGGMIHVIPRVRNTPMVDYAESSWPAEGEAVHEIGGRMGGQMLRVPKSGSNTEGEMMRMLGGSGKTS
ncbi:hypothetical protein BGX38DRAFT_1174584 [Terfezia claveryi]|nr:hypothetical protein BGX38DRAFT_1174584 [Terfezia claveryi]